MRQWFRIQNNAGSSTADLFIRDVIGAPYWEGERTVPASAFIEQLQALPAGVRTLRVFVHSPGGDPLDAIAIANALREQRTGMGRTVEVTIEGLAASAATLVTSAGGPVRMHSNGLFMVHDPVTAVAGNARELESAAAALRRVTDAMVDVYRWVSPKSGEEIRSLMAASTWLSADEAKAAGFVTYVIPTIGAPTASASFSPAALAVLGAVPGRHAARAQRYGLKVAATSGPKNAGRGEPWDRVFARMNGGAR